jgi:ClpP class serine protease
VKRQHRYTARAGTALAIKPEAFSWLFDEMDEPAPLERHGCVAVVPIRGALEQRGSWWGTGYDSIVASFEAALSTDASCIVLDIDSCGGTVAGCFAAVRQMRAMAAASGKQVVAFANESAYSAAYALATVAGEIYVPESGGLGSIGVIGMVDDYTERMAMEGIKCAVLTTGARKSDGNPMSPMSDASLAALQGTVDRLGAQFFGLVAEARPLTAEAVQALEAGCFLGMDAVDAGLADEVISRVDLLARLSGKDMDMSDESKPEMEEKETDEEMAAEGENPDCETTETDDAEGEEEEAEDEKEAPAAAAAHTSRDILAMVRTVTGQTSPAAQIGALHALVTEAKKARSLQARISKLEGASKASAHKARVDGAIKAGKIAPAQRQWAMGVDGKVLDGFLASASPVAPAAITPKAPDASVGLTASEKKIAKAMGISEAVFNEQKAAIASRH